MDLNGAKDSFGSLVSSIKSTDDKDAFLRWVSSYSEDFHSNNCCNNECAQKPRDDRNKADVVLSCIKTLLKQKLPLNATVSSETILFPTIGEDSHLTDENCIHVDAFLYEEDDVDELVETGKLSNSYCVDCKSRNIEDLTFITHSASKKCLEYIFTHVLKELKGKVVLDVGSRLGVVLYAAYVYSEANEIIGVEMNSDLCDLQSEMINRFKMSDRCKVLDGDIRNMPNVVIKADVIVLNNVFEWFLSPREQETVWKYLHSKIKPGATIVAAPPIESSLEPINTGINVETWLQEIVIDTSISEKEFVEEINLKFYKVL